jgi:APA family basic amino acid/polyamine antiporter
MAKPEGRSAEGLRPGQLAGNPRVVRRIKRELRLQRTLGVPALFSSGYGNVGSSIYYALGVTAVFALGATPFALALAGVFFILTVFTYTEATVAVPEAGGASNFARQGFNELISFITGWGTLLSYTVTISISAFSAVGYLGVFFPIFQQESADVIGAIVIILLLAGLNLVGAEEASTLSVVFAVLDLSTEVVLVIVGGIFLVVWATVAHPFFLHQIHWGTAPSGLNFIQGAAIAMVAYTGIETISNLSEEAKDPEKTVPRSYATLIFAVLILFVGISIVALSALPVFKDSHGQYTTLLAQQPPKGFITDPVAGIAGQLPHPASDILKPLVAVLAATILLIAANAGILGASRLSFSMGTYRQVPAILNKIHPRFGTPSVAIIFFSVVAVVIVIPGDITLLTALYIFGSTLGFTMAHASLIAMRLRGAKHTWRAPLNIPVGGGRSIPLTAVIGGLGTLGVWVLQGLGNPFSRYVGLAWMIGGAVLYVLYRRTQHLPITRSVERQFEER